MGLFDTGVDSDKLADIVDRLERIEEKLDRLLAQPAGAGGAVAGVAAGAPDAAQDALEAEVIALLRKSRKIQAIKIWRERTGVGLKDAKQAVEAIQYKR